MCSCFLRLLPAVLIIQMLPALIGCSLETESQVPAMAPSRAATAQTPVNPKASAKLSDSPAPKRSDDPDLPISTHLQEASVKGVTLLSPRSLSLRIHLNGDPDGVFKPLKKDNGTARYEVAYYRMTRLLKAGTVPVSVMRRFSLARLEGYLSRTNPEAAKALTEAARTDDKGRVWGAMIQWMNDMVPSNLEDPGAIPRIRSLAGPEADPLDPLTREISNMVVLDYCLGNWDRFSGGNLFKRSSDPVLLLIDNNGAFGRWSSKKQDRLDRTLAAVHYFDRTLLSRLKSLNVSQIQNAMKVPDWPGQLLQDGEIQRVLSRRDALLAYVTPLIEQNNGGNLLP